MKTNAQKKAIMKALDAEKNPKVKGMVSKKFKSDKDSYHPSFSSSHSNIDRWGQDRK